MLDTSLNQAADSERKTNSRCESKPVLAHPEAKPLRSAINDHCCDQQSSDSKVARIQGDRERPNGDSQAPSAQGNLTVAKGETSFRQLVTPNDQREMP